MRIKQPMAACTLQQTQKKTQSAVYNLDYTIYNLQI